MYTLVLVGTIIVFGRLSDKYGRLKVYYWGLVIFLIASILCGLSSSLIELLGFRALQGIGAAMLQATAIAIVPTFIPKERLGQALGTMGVLIGIGPVLGPSIGGFLLTIGNWRWIFWINIPFVLMGMIGCRFLLKRIEESRSNIKLNISGSLLLTLSILTLLQGVSLLASIGTVNGDVIRRCILFISLCTCFIFWEKKSKQPIIHSFETIPTRHLFCLYFGIFILGDTTSLGFIIPPYFFGKIVQLEPWKAGIVNLFAPLGLMIMSKISGRLMKIFNSISLMMSGLAIMTCSFVVLSFMEFNWRPVVVAMLLFVSGVGAGMFVTPNTTTIMGTVDKEFQGTIGSIQRMIQNLGIALYAAITSAFIRAHSNGDVNELMIGFRHAWAFAATSIFGSCLVFIFLFINFRKKSHFLW
ncbi:MFS transporter [Heyndrickxia sporothermodurans]|nr:MFS transporter [Heyndrickxia sporothermodurans]